MKRWFSRSELVAVFGQCLLDSCWVFAVLRVIAALSPSALVVSWGALLVLQLMAALAARVIVALHWPLALQLPAAGLVLWSFLRSTLAPGRAGLTLSELVEPTRYGVDISGPLTFVVWVVAMFSTARGVLIGARTARPAQVRRQFLIGAIALVITFALVARGGVAEAALPSVELQVLTSAYFLGGCCLCALIERNAAHARQQLPVQRSAAFALALVLPVLALALGSALLATLLLGVGTVIAHFQHAFFLALEVAGHVIVAIAALLVSIVKLLTLTSGAPSDETKPGSHASDEGFGLSRWHNPLVHTEMDSLPAMLALAALVIVGWYVSALLRARVRVQEADVAFDSTSLLSWRSLHKNWRNRLLSARALMSRGGRELARRVRVRRAPRDMRAVYRELLRWAAAHGGTRRSGTTPQELARELSVRFPDRRPELQALTDYYNATRYGARPFSEAELQHARALLAELEQEPSRQQ